LGGQSYRQQGSLVHRNPLGANEAGTFQIYLALNSS
jgi:hypothetical protein